MTPEKRYFILGMITAFSECVAAGCKRLALSPPLYGQDYQEIREEAEALITRHGLVFDVEKNEDAPEDMRWTWLLIAARPETISAWHALRAQGHSPVKSLEPFAELLSYNPSEGVSMHYDAFRVYFPININ